MLSHLDICNLILIRRLTPDRVKRVGNRKPPPVEPSYACSILSPLPLTAFAVSLKFATARASIWPILHFRMFGNELSCVIRIRRFERL